MYELAGRIAAHYRAKTGEGDDLMAAGPGPWPLFSEAGFQERMRGGETTYFGTAASLFNLDLTVPGMANAGASEHEVKAFRQEVFAKCGPQSPPQWPKEVAVVVLSTDTPGEPGKWRKTTPDKMLFAFLLEWWDRISPNSEEVPGAALSVTPPPLGADDGSGAALPTLAELAETDVFLRAARHVPMKFYFIAPSGRLEEDIFVRCVQDHEDLHIGKERFAASGWRMCKFYAQARLMKRTAGGDGPELGGVEALLRRVEYGKTSDFRLDGVKKGRLIEDSLRTYDRIVGADLVDLLDEAEATWGHKCPLVSLGKLNLLAQRLWPPASKSKGAAPAEESSPPGSSVFQLAMRCLFARMTRLVAPADMSHADLAKEEIPRLLVLATVLPAAVRALSYPADSPEAKAIRRLEVPGGLTASEAEACVQSVSRPSAAAAIKWGAGLHQGKSDAVLMEIGRQTQRMAPEAMLLHGKLGFAEIAAKLKGEEAEAEKIALLGQASGAPGAAAAPTSPTIGCETDEAAGADREAGSPRAPPPTTPSSKEELKKKLLAARRQHCEEKFAGLITLVVRPDTPRGFQDLLESSLFVQGAPAIAGESGSARHAWMYDPGADSEPSLAEKHGNATRRGQGEREAWTQFFTAVRSWTAPVGMLLWWHNMAPAPHAEFAQEVLQPADGAFHGDPDVLHIVFKEDAVPGARQARTQLLDQVSAYMSLAVPRASRPEGPRLYYSQTSLCTNVIVAADGLEESAGRVPRELKSSILPSASEQQEAEAAQLFCQDKHPRVIEEVLHHFGITTLCVLSPGCGSVLRAALRMKIPCMALARNQAHADFLRESVVAWMLEELAKAEAPWHKSDASFADDLGLTLGDSSSSASSSATTDGEEDGDQPQEEQAAAAPKATPKATPKAATNAKKGRSKAQGAALAAAQAPQKRKRSSSSSAGTAPADLMSSLFAGAPAFR